MASGKSPSAGSADPTAEDVADDAELPEITFIFNFTNRVRRLVEPGRGTASSPDPWISKPGEVGRLTMKLRRAPPPEGKRADTKLQTDTISASKTPPAGTIPTPTLCTSLDPWIPTPERPPEPGESTDGRRARWGDAVGSGREEDSS